MYFKMDADNLFDQDNFRQLIFKCILKYITSEKVL